MRTSASWLRGVMSLPTGTRSDCDEAPVDADLDLDFALMHVSNRSFDDAKGSKGVEVILIGSKG